MGSGWRRDNRLRLHFWRFRLFNNRFNLNLNVLNDLFSGGFDEGFSGFFYRGYRFSLFSDFLSHQGIFFGDKLRCCINRRGNHFWMGGFNFHCVRCFSFNNLRFNHGCRFSHDSFYRGCGCNHLFGYRLFFNNLLRASNRVADPDFAGGHFW